MSIPATEAAGQGLFNPAGAASTTQAQEDKAMFLELLVAQLRYQDPLNPADSTQFMSQTAQFNALEQMQAVAQQTAQLLSSQMAFGATGLVGQTVSYLDADGTPVSGSVSGVTFGASGPILDIDGAQVPLLDVLSVGTTSPTIPHDPSTESGATDS